MKAPHLPALCLAALAAIALVTPAFAVVNIDYVTIGNAGNAADSSTGYGAVAYEYQIGKYEVTNSQYAQFLNAKGASNSADIYNSTMSLYGITRSGSSGSYTYSVTSGFENKPVAYVSWFDAARFTNWLGNGQGGGDMETGAYTLNGATSGIIMVNPGATVYLPSEDEWYKAAFYNGSTAAYSLYPNGQNSITTADANFYGNNIFATTNVGNYTEDPSYYGTFDQGGNVREWNDAVVSGSARGLRGGSYGDQDYHLSTFRNYLDPTEEAPTVGFRLVTVVPEPTSLVLTLLASGSLLLRRKRG